MASPYRVFLDGGQRAYLRTLAGSGIAPARRPAGAPVLLKADHGEGGPGWSDGAVAGALDVHSGTVQRIRRRFAEEGLAATMERNRPDRVYEQRVDGVLEANLVTLACAAPPDGQARWSLRLPADEPVRLEVVEAVSHETVRRAPKQMASGRGRAGSDAWPRPRTPPSSAPRRTSSPLRAPTTPPAPSSAST